MEKPNLKPKQLKLVNYLLEGKSQQESLELAGYKPTQSLSTRRYITKALEYYKEQQTIELSKKNIVTKEEMTHKLLNIVNSETASNRDKTSAAKVIGDWLGWNSQPQVQINNNQIMRLVFEEDAENLNNQVIESTIIVPEK